MHAVSSQFNFDLEQSCSGLVIVDPHGVPKENGIQIKSSRHDFKDDGLETDTVLGEVVIARKPCKIPTDSRKVDSFCFWLHSLIKQNRLWQWCTQCWLI